MKRFKVESNESGKRLDKFLTEQLPNFSRSQIQKMIKNKLVTVNDKIISPHHFLKTGDKLSFRPSPAKAGRVEESLDNRERDFSTKFTPSNDGARNDIEIIHEDDDILVINKPAGLLVHARIEPSKEKEPTLVDWLIKKYPKIKKVGDPANAGRPGIVHRLDKDASGVMVIAKNQVAFEAIKKQFHDRQVIKEYVALTYGQIKADCANIEFPIGRAREGGKMAARAKETEGKPSITAIEVINRFPNCTLIKAFPKTGRTHQIRVHLFALGNPLVGDQLYKSKNFKPIATGRLMLHSYKLTLKDLSGEEKTFIAPIPSEFNKFLE